MERRWKLLTLSSFLVLALGLGLTIARGPKAVPPSLGKVKSLDQYWNDTGLRPEILTDVVDDESCHSSRRYFLACVNAVTTVAGRLGFEVTLKGELVKSTFAPPSEQTELRLLTPWKDIYTTDPEKVRTVSFGSLWQKLMNLPAALDQKATLTSSALNAFLSVFRDPHTYILPIDYYQNVIANAQASSALLGIVLARSEKGYFLRKVIEGSPASLAGLQRGDWVLSVNGIPLKDHPPQRLGDLLKAVEGELTRVEISRNGRTHRFEVQRSAVPVPSVAWRPLDGGKPVGVLTLHKFAQGSCQDMKAALLEMKVRRLQGLLLDLRDNSGGQMDEAACMVSLFLGRDKAAFRIRYLDPARDPETHYGAESMIWTGKVAVLVNSGTASAAEILAGSLRDHGRALLVGERTFGKGSFQEGEIWKRNSRVAFFQTKGFYYLPSGYSPQLKGVAPDVQVSFRQSLALREEDQYLNPLTSPSRVGEPKLRGVDLSSCPAASGFSEDPQLSRAQSALFCESIAGGPRASL